jgi:hypothetical protein
VKMLPLYVCILRWVKIKSQILITLFINLYASHTNKTCIYFANVVINIQNNVNVDILV